MTTETLDKTNPTLFPAEAEKRDRKADDKDSTTQTGSPNPPDLDDAKTAGVFTRDYVEIGEQRIVGESEPNYDNAYKRADLELLQGEDGTWLNANKINFESSMPWEGPIISIAAFDSDGKVMGKALVPDEPRMPAGQTINIEPHNLRFQAVQPRGEI